MQKLWNDDSGIVIQTELVFLLTILVIGTVTALVALRQAIISELTEISQSLMALNQSYSFSGQSNCQSSTAGSASEDVQNAFPIGEVSVPSGPGIIVDQQPCD